MIIGGVESSSEAAAETMGVLTNGSQLTEHILYWADVIRRSEVNWVTGIYPGEMAAFLGVCDMRGVRTIIESGRGEHAFSTQILGEFSEKTGVAVISVDYSPVQGKGFEHTLGRYARLHCVAGDSFDVLPKIIPRVPTPIGLLVDGPKLWSANRLSLVASELFEIAVVAHHNCPLSSPWGRQFSRLFPGAFHYEDLGLAGDRRWQEFKRWETQWVRNYELPNEVHRMYGRSLKMSSLAIAVRKDPAPLSGVRLLLGPVRPLRQHPLWLRLIWAREAASVSKRRDRWRSLEDDQGLK